MAEETRSVKVNQPKVTRPSEVNKRTSILTPRPAAGRQGHQRYARGKEDLIPGRSLHNALIAPPVTVHRDRDRLATAKAERFPGEVRC